MGGVWAKSRIYPGLNYEVPAPMLNFTDFDMCKELGIKEWDVVNGDQVNELLVFAPFGCPGVLLTSIDKICNKI